MVNISSIRKAFELTPRKLFLPEFAASNALLDVPIPIGFGQTNSQPSTVFDMLSWLSIKPGDKVLDVGSGSGWTTALLSRLVGHKGKVTAVEIVPELVDFGKSNCSKLDIKNVRFYEATPGIVGYPKNAPYNKILVSAAAQSVPQTLIDQLSDNGTLVIPVNNYIYVIEKFDGVIETTKHSGYVFVPLL